MKRSTFRFFLGLCAGLVLVAGNSKVRAVCLSGPPVCFAAPGDRVCSNDNTKQCQVNADCPGGTCNAPSVLAIGGSVTANPNSISTVVLTGDTNLTLLKSTLPSGLVTFRVFPTNSALDASGEVLATDSGSFTCTVPVSFRIRAAGAASNEPVCPLAQLYSLDVLTSPVSPAGTTACSSHLATCSDLLPPSYAFLSDSRILTVRSPIAGVVLQELTRSGTFDSTMRMMFARSVDSGVTFTSYADITTSVTSGSTKIRGTPQWSDVKVVGVLYTGGVVTVPTLGEWGLILMTLMLLGVSTSLLLRRRLALAANGSLTAAGPPLFAPGSFVRILAATTALALAADAAFALAGRAPSGTDVLGSLSTAAIVAYIAQVWLAARSRSA